MSTMRYIVAEVWLRQESPYLIAYKAERGLMYSTDWLIEANIVRAAFLTAYMHESCPRIQKHIQHSQDIGNICRASLINVCGDCPERTKCPIYLDVATCAVTWHLLLPVPSRDLVSWYQTAFIGKCKICPRLIVLASFRTKGTNEFRLPYDMFTDEKESRLVSVLEDIIKVATVSQEVKARVLTPETCVRTEVAISKVSSTSAFGMLYSYEAITYFNVSTVPIVPEHSLGKEKLSDTLSRMLVKDSEKKHGNDSCRLYWTFIAVRNDMSTLIDALRQVREVRIGRAVSRGFGRFIVEKVEVYESVDKFVETRLKTYLRYLEKLYESCISRYHIIPLLPESRLVVVPRRSAITLGSTLRAIHILLRRFFRDHGVGDLELEIHVEKVHDTLRLWSATSNVPKLSCYHIPRSAKVFVKVSHIPRELINALTHLYVVGLQSSDEVLTPSGFNVLKVPIVDICGLP